MGDLFGFLALMTLCLSIPSLPFWGPVVYRRIEAAIDPADRMITRMLKHVGGFYDEWEGSGSDWTHKPTGMRMQRVGYVFDNFRITAGGKQYDFPESSYHAHLCKRIVKKLAVGRKRADKLDAISGMTRAFDRWNARH